jgi:hypothetical protein
MGQKRTWRPVLVIGLLFWFALRLIRNAERSFHAACYTAYGAANDGSNCPANRACRSASFPGSLARSLLRATDNALRTRHDWYGQSTENSNKNKCCLHLHPPIEK